MNLFLDLMYQLLTSPRQAFRVLTRGERLRQAGALWLFVVFLLSLTSLADGAGLGTAFFLCFLGMAILLFLHSAVIDYCAGLLGGSGTAKGITAGFMAASFPYAFLVFGGLLSAFGGMGESLLGYAVFLWSFALDVLAVSENYRFSTGKALAVALIPAALFVLAAACFFFLGLFAAVSGLAQMEDLGAAAGVLQSL